MFEPLEIIFYILQKEVGAGRSIIYNKVGMGDQKVEIKLWSYFVGTGALTVFDKELGIIIEDKNNIYPNTVSITKIDKFLLQNPLV